MNLLNQIRITVPQTVQPKEVGYYLGLPEQVIDKLMTAEPITSDKPNGVYEIRLIIPQTVRVQEAADYTGLSKDTIRKLYKQKKLPCIRPNGYNSKVLFRIPTLDQWMDQQEELSLEGYSDLPTEHVRNLRVTL